jgi:LuxR family transcriptional regulator, positive regulator of biofilm formation
LVNTLLDEVEPIEPDARCRKPDKAELQNRERETLKEREGARMLRDVLTQKGLSNREAEVAELVTKGLSNKEVASQLFVTEKTVKFHLTNIYKKMNVKSRAQLIVWCMPHLSFAEEANEAPAATANNQAANNTIPAGSSPISGIKIGS